jgi:flagellar assembly factor FliW
LEILGWKSNRQPRIGQDVLCLTVLSFQKSGTTANLLAPVVVDLNNRRAVQAVAQESVYSHQHALFAQEASVC